MERKIHENISDVRVEVHCGKIYFRRSEDHTVRIVAANMMDNNIRIHSHKNRLSVKCILQTPTEIQIYLPEVLNSIEVISDSCQLNFNDIELNYADITSGGDIIMKNIIINKSCNISAEHSLLNIIGCNIRSMNAQLFNSNLEFKLTVLYGNNVVYIVNGNVMGTLKGALIDYVISAGSGVDPSNVIVNDHFLLEFPERKNVQNCAWLLLAGSLNSTARIKIVKPKTSISGIY